MKCRLVAAAAMLGLVLGASPSIAQNKAPSGGASQAKKVSIRDSLPESVRKDWDAARDLYEAKDYRGALVQFQRAFELSRNPRVLFNVGVCEKSLQHYSRAIAKWNQQLAEADDKVPADELQQVREAIAALQPYVSTVEVTADQPGATLYIDDQVIGDTPLLGPVAIDVGKRMLKLTKKGFQDKVIELTITAGTPGRASFVLEPLVRKSAVSVAVVGARGAHVTVDGIDMGPAPFRGEVVVGRHTFEARAPGFVTVRQTSEVVFEKPVDMILSMAAERHSGKVRVTVSESDAIVEIDGKVRGSGTWEGVLPAGGHQLVVRKPGFQTYSTDLALNDDQVRNVTVPLSRERGAAWFYWAAGSVAVVAGAVVATYFVTRPSEQTPVTGTLAPGLIPANLHGGQR
ncbi:MAG: PEGA domain-containing protein [Deltaproteobacteria bacterium]|nr:PEGA domain-containing protein [Deltaproteobacteria bacterium]